MKERLIEIIKQAGHLIQQMSEKGFEVYTKDSINNLVTEVDRAAEIFIKSEVRKSFPEHGFLAEEYGDEKSDADFVWIIDPIDGTVNFAHNLPLYCVSIAIVFKTEVIMGAIYNPVSKELFFAEKGKGAYFNNKKIQVSNQGNFQNAFLVTGFPYDHPQDIDITRVFSTIVKDKIPVRRLGSAALDLAYVAAGRFDAFWEYNLSPWDIAAGYLLVQEAGGRVTDFNKNEGHYLHRQTLASNGKIHDILLEKILQFSK